MHQKYYTNGSIFTSKKYITDAIQLCIRKKHCIAMPFNPCVKNKCYYLTLFIYASQMHANI